MKYNNLIGLVIFSTFFLSGFTFCSSIKSRQYFERFLEHSSYAPHVITYLREKYTESLSDINDIIETHYIIEYRRAIKNKKTFREKRMLLDIMGLHLLLSPGAIERGQEGPALMETNDGSDRGGCGLRMKALKKVQDKVELEQDARRQK